MTTIKRKRTVKYILNDIPLEEESSRRHLPILVCILVYFLIIVLVTAISVGGSFKKWQDPYSKKVTIELIQDGEKSIDIERVLKVLPTIQGVLSFEVVSNDEMLLLLKPWIGDIDIIKDIKLPTLIDIELTKDGRFSPSEAERKLKEIVSNVRIESHLKWHDTVTSFVSSVRIISYGVVGFILLSIMIIVSVTTRASLNIHKNTVDTLRLMGARNLYILSYFQNSSFYLCLKGGLFGLIMSIPTIIFLRWMSRRVGMSDFFIVETQIWLWAIILFIPFIISVLSMLVSKLSISRMLMRMDA